MCSLAQYDINIFSFFRKPQFYTIKTQDILFYKCEGNVDGNGDVDGDGDKKNDNCHAKKNLFCIGATICAHQYLGFVRYAVFLQCHNF